MKVMINGEAKDCTAPLNVRDVLDGQGYGDMLVAVARNGEFVAKGTYGDVMVEEGDLIEIVSPMQGG